MAEVHLASENFRNSRNFSSRRSMLSFSFSFIETCQDCNATR